MSKNIRSLRKSTMWKRLVLASLIASSFSGTGLAQPGIKNERSFSERYALSSHREALLSELIPGTESYYQYHSLFYQTVGKYAESRKFLDEWVGKFGLTEPAQSMLLRQVLLEYSQFPEATTKFLEERYGLQLNHPAPQRDEAATLPTSLDEKILLFEELAKARFASSRFSAFDDPSALLNLGTLKSREDYVEWISKIQRIDIPGLLPTLADELKHPQSQGFGWAPIHNELSTLQLEELQKLVPNLQESSPYIHARLRKIRPLEGDSTENPLVLGEHLKKLWEYVSTLPSSQNSLKAHVLYQQLQLDEQKESYDLDRFQQFLKLPNLRPIVNRLAIEKFRVQFPIELQSDFESVTLLPPIRDDSSLIERYLEHFFRKGVSIDAFSELLDRNYLTQVYAKTRILYGSDDAKLQASKLTPEVLKELQNRIELSFLPTNKKMYRGSDSVQVQLQLKNTSEVLVKIYKLNSREVLLKSDAGIHSGLDVDGLKPNHERKLTFDLPAERRHEESLDLPELEGVGVWIVDFLAAGRRSRTLIQKGNLVGLHTLSDVGNLIRIMDESGAHAPDATAWFGEREFKPDADGNIVIPFSNEQKVAQVVFTRGALATRERFVHHAENFSLNSHFLCDTQQMLSGTSIRAALRAVLWCNGKKSSIDQLEDAKVAIRFVDLDGIESVRDFAVGKLNDDREHEIRFVVPPRTAKVQFELKGRVRKLFNDTWQDLSSTQTLEINQTALLSQSRDAFLRKSFEGYCVEIRGRNGEPIRKLPVTLQLKQEGLTEPVTVRLATDDAGSVKLGNVANTQWVSVQASGMQPRTFQVKASHQDWPTVLTALLGDTIELPVDANRPSLLPRFELRERRSEQTVALETGKIESSQNQLVIRDLPEGTFLLRDHQTGASLTIRIVQGNVKEGVIESRRWVGETEASKFLTVSSVTHEENQIKIQLDNISKSTRVHIVATPFYETLDLSSLLRSSRSRPEFRTIPYVGSRYLNSLKLDDEYQYVIDRRNTKQYPGVMLPSPSVLLNPWELNKTTNSTKLAEEGESIPELSVASPQEMPQNDPQAAPRVQQAAFVSEFEFLKNPALLVTNLVPDENGKIVVDAKNLSAVSHLQIIAIDAKGTASYPLNLSKTELSVVDRRTKSQLQSDKHYSEDKTVTSVEAGIAKSFGDAQATRIKVVASLRDVLAIYRGLLGDHASFQKWDELLGWEKLNEEERIQLYSRIASHEANLFLYRHDRAFFDKVIAPYLKNKSSKQFVDQYLLGESLEKYAQPWRMAQLNTAEKILLASRVPKAKGAIERSLRDWLDANPKSLEQIARAFDTSLNFFSDSELDGLAESDFKEWNMRGATKDNLFGLQDKAAWDEAKIALKAQDAPAISGMMGGMGGMPGGSGYGGGMEADSNARFRSESLGRSNRRSGEESRDLKGKKLKAYEAIESTRKWAETQYLQIPLAAQNAMLIPPSKFWLEYLASERLEGSFISENIELAADTPTSALMALAFIRLPLQSESIAPEVVDGKWQVESKSASIVFSKGIHVNSEAVESSGVLLAQQIYPAFEGSDTSKPIQGQKLVKGLIYRLRTVVTNPTPEVWNGNVIQFLPVGCIPIAKSKSMNSLDVQLQPFGSQEMNALFYMPVEGDYELPSSQLSSKSKPAGRSNAVRLQVEATPSNVDVHQWPYIAAWGTEQQILDHLDQCNIAKTDFSLLLWRLKDESTYRILIDKLTSLGVYHSGVWAYSWKHQDLPRIREYLSNSPGIVERVLPAFDSEVLDADVESRMLFEQFDFRPLALARFHALADKPMILNDALQTQYDAFMKKMSYQPSPSAIDRLSLVYYLLLQNRIDDALVQFAQVDRDASDCQLQFDYMDAYLGFYQGHYDRSLEIANRYKAYPNSRWNSLFQQVRDHIATRKLLESGNFDLIRKTGDTNSLENRILLGERDSDQNDLANLQTSLELESEEGKLHAVYRNADSLEIRFYLMDIELQFSRTPFLQRDNSQLSLIEANRTTLVKVEKEIAPKLHKIEIPADLQNQNVLVEVVSNGIARSQMLYANSLKVTLSTTAGRLQLSTKGKSMPVESAYVKVYRKGADGSVGFYKDGYTDLRGQFDYTSLSVDELKDVERFAILVLHPELGAVAQEVAPPKR